MGREIPQGLSQAREQHVNAGPRGEEIPAASRPE